MDNGLETQALVFFIKGHSLIYSTILERSLLVLGSCIWRNCLLLSNYRQRF